MFRLIRFKLTLSKTRRYDLYPYLPRRSDAVYQTTFPLHDGQKSKVELTARVPTESL